MKSLDAVNEKIRKHEGRIINIQTHEEYGNELYQLKKDLERLEFLETNLTKITDKFKIQIYDLKEELEKYKELLNLVKQLVDEIRLDANDIYDGDTYCYTGYIMEDRNYNTFEISNELFNILDDLKKFVGAFNE